MNSGPFAKSGQDGAWAPPVLDLNRVCKSYKRGSHEVRALADVSLTVRRGEFTAVIGPSGSGKSTLLHVMGLLDGPTSGMVSLDGRDTSGMSGRELARARNSRIGFVFQSFHLLPRFSALDNVALPLLYAGRKRGDARRAAGEALASVGLAARGLHRPSELSGGECQRVAIARAMVMGPSLVLADEPTGNLDMKTGQGVLDLLEELHLGRNSTIIVVTHDPAVAARCEGSIRLEDGVVVADDRPGDKGT